MIKPENELSTRNGIAVLALNVLAGVIAVLIPFIWGGSQPGPEPIHLDPDVLSQASALAGATEVVVVPPSGSSAITITFAPEPTTVTEYVVKAILK